MNQNQIKKLYTKLFNKILNIILPYDKIKIYSIPQQNRIKEALNDEIKKEITGHHNAMKVSLLDRFKKLSEKKYLRTLFNSEKRSKINISKRLINKVDDIIKKIVNKKVAGKTMTERLTRNKNDVIKEARKIINKMTFEGKSIDEIAKKLRDALNIDKNRSLLIARTEAHRIQEESSWQGREAVRQSGIEFKDKWLATLDARTRDTHQRLDGKYADEDGYFYSEGRRAKYPGGFGVAKEDIRCRCTVIQEFEEIQGTNTRYVQENDEYINYRNYEEWRNQ